MRKTHYEVLDVDQLAGGAKIKRHYYELCKKYHPDMAGGDPQKMVAINEAYRILSDSTLRSAYDREIAAQQRETASAHTTTTRQANAQPKTAQTAWQDMTFQQKEQEPTVFRRAAQTAQVKKKHTGAVWFVTLGSIIAVALIAVSYLAPFPQPATATNTPTTPSIATADSADTSGQTDSTADSTGTGTGTATTDPNSQTALNTLQSDTTPTTPAPTTTTTPTTSTSQTQPPKKHHHPFSFWLPQDN